MEAKKCARCGAFYTNKANVCPKCAEKDNFELTTFKKFVKKTVSK